MNATYQAVSIILLLLPGYVARWIYSQTRYRKPGTDFEMFVEMVLWSGFISALMGIFSQSSGIVVFSSDTTTQAEFSKSPSIYAELFAFTIVLPAVIGYLLERNVFHSAVKFVFRHDRDAKNSQWEKFFSNNEKFVFVHLKDKDGTILFGFPNKYSMDYTEGMFELDKPRIVKVSPDGSLVYEKFAGKSVFIVNRSDILFISRSSYPKEMEGGEDNGKRKAAVAAGKGSK